MPFGRAPAPAEMQSYVATTFGTLRNELGQEIVCPCMDDLKVSSLGLERHIRDMQFLCEKASAEGFEFKLVKGQFNPAEIEFWECICDGTGRRPAPRRFSS